jgi:hypothetical protein
MVRRGDPQTSSQGSPARRTHSTLDFRQEQLVGIDIDRASKIVNLSRFELEALPLTTAT